MSGQQLSTGCTLNVSAGRKIRSKANQVGGIHFKTSGSVGQPCSSTCSLFLYRLLGERCPQLLFFARKRGHCTPFPFELHAATRTPAWRVTWAAPKKTGPVSFRVLCRATSVWSRQQLSTWSASKLFLHFTWADSLRFPVATPSVYREIPRKIEGGSLGKKWGKKTLKH